MMSDWKYSLKQVETLLNDKEFRWELRTYKRAYQRLKVRFRNSNHIAKLKVIIAANRKLVSSFPPDLFHSFGTRIDNSTSKKLKKNLKNLKVLVAQFIRYLDDTLDKTIQTYSGTQSQFKVGHLIHHWIVLRSSIARMRIFYKALLVYATDLYLDLPSPSTELSEETISQILKHHDCKPRIEKNQPKRDINAQQEENPGEEAIGQLIDRSTMRPVK